MAWPQRLRSRWEAHLPHLFDQWSRRRGDGHRLELSGYDGARASGGVGGLAGRLSAKPAVQMVELERQLRRRRRARPEMGRGVGRRRGRLPETRRRGAVRRGIAARRANWLSLAAAPTFAIMALLTAFPGAGPSD